MKKLVLFALLFFISCKGDTMLVNVNKIGNRQLYQYRLDKLWANEKVNFTGSHIYVLNDYVPLPTFTFVSDKQVDLLGYAASTVRDQSQFLIYPLNGNSHYQIPFERLYFTSAVVTGYVTYLVNTLQMATTGGTLLNLLVSENELAITPITSGGFWQHNFASTLPAIAGQADFIVLHNSKATVSINVTIPSAVNPIRVRILQQAIQIGTADRVDVDVWPSSFPYNECFTLPLRVSNGTRVIVDGGGAAETGSIYIEHIERVL